MADIRIDRYEVDVSTNGQTQTITNVGSVNSAFVRVLGPVNKNSAGPTGSTANTNPNVAACAVELTSTTQVTFRKSTSTTVKVMFEIWVYTGSSGGAYEFIVRQRGNVSLFSAPGSVAISGMTSRNACIPFHNGMTSGITNTAGYDRTTLALHIDASNNLIVSNGAAEGEEGTVYYTVVEFTGSSWNVGHAWSNAHDDITQTVTMSTDSTGQGGSTFDVSDWGTAMIIEATLEGDTSETGLADVQGLWYPAAGTTQIVYSQVDLDANARNDADAYAHILQTDSLNVYRAVNTNVPEGNGTYGTVSWPTGAPTTGGIDVLSLEWFVGSSGTGTAHLRGSLHAQIRDNAGYEIQHWVHRSGNAVEARYGVADLSALSDVGTILELASDITTNSVVSVNATIISELNSDLNTNSTISANSTVIEELDTVINTDSTVTANITLIADVDSDINTSSGVSANAGIIVGTGTIANTNSQVDALLTLIAELASNINTGSTVTINATALATLVASISGSSTITATAVLSKALNTDITTSSSITADAGLIKTLSSAASTNSTVTALATLTEALSSSISTTSAVSAALVILAALQSDINTSSTVTANLEIAGEAIDLASAILTGSNVESNLTSLQSLTSSLSTSSSLQSNLTILTSLTTNIAGSSTFISNATLIKGLEANITTGSTVIGNLTIADTSNLLLSSNISTFSTVTANLELVEYPTSIATCLDAFTVASRGWLSNSLGIAVDGYICIPVKDSIQRRPSGNNNADRYLPIYQLREEKITNKDIIADDKEVLFLTKVLLEII